MTTLKIFHKYFAHRLRKRQKYLATDMVHEGILGGHHAAYRFDDSRKLKFITFAYWHIRKSMGYFMQHHTRSVRLPAEVEQLLGVISQMQRDHKNKHIGENVPPLTNFELAQRIGERKGKTTDDEVKMLYRIICQAMEGNKQENMPQAQTAGESTPHVGIFAAKDDRFCTVEQSAEVTIAHDAIIQAMRILDHREALIFSGRRGLGVVPVRSKAEPHKREFVSDRLVDKQVLRKVMKYRERDANGCQVIDIDEGLFGVKQTLEELGERFGVQRERIRQLEDRAEKLMLLANNPFSLAWRRQMAELYETPVGEDEEPLQDDDFSIMEIMLDASGTLRPELAKAGIFSVNQFRSFHPHDLYTASLKSGHLRKLDKAIDEATAVSAQVQQCAHRALMREHLKRNRRKNGKKKKRSTTRVSA